MNKLLTKSKYLQGLQCSKLLWIAVNDKTRFPKPDAAQQQIFDTGTEVGVLATTLFDGIKVPEVSFMGNIFATKKLLTAKKTLFEAGFLVDNLFSRADILVPVEDSWDIIEVKSSTSVKDVNIHDVSFQKLVYEKAGLKIRKCFLMFINNEYVRQGDLDVNQLFVREDITSQVDEFSVEIEERIEKMFSIINSDEPVVSIGVYCSDPYVCALKDECWKFLPSNNVFCLSRGGKKSWLLFDLGINEIKDIPADFKLTSKQEIQHRNEVFIDKGKIKDFISKLVYPIYYFDFETINPCIPLYDGMKPYQRLPFQYSLHIQQEDGSIEHKSFLANPGDCRSDILKSMKENLGSVGTILTWNQSFEIGVIKELIAFDNSYSSFGASIIERIDDLIIPFRNFFYYNPLQQGSASLKKVLPVFSSLSYKDLEIGNGADASCSFMKIVTGSVSADEVDRIRAALEKYCELDTFAEVEILKELMKLVS